MHTQILAGAALMGLALATPAAAQQLRSTSSLESFAWFDFTLQDTSSRNSVNVRSKVSAPCGWVSDLASARPLATARTQSGYALDMPPSAFPAAVRGSADYWNNTLQFKITAKPGDSVSAVFLRMQILHDKDSVITGYDLYADEETGPGGDNFQTLLKTGVFPRAYSSNITHDALWLRIDDIALLQQKHSVELRLNFFGEVRSANPTTTMLDDIRVEGLCGPCILAGTVVPMGPANCANNGQPTLTMNPLGAGQFTVLVAASNYASGSFTFMMSRGFTTPTQVIQPSGCTMYVDPNALANFGPFALDTAGNAAFTLAVPANNELIGTGWTTQGSITHPNGVNLTEAYATTIGCR